ncbi:MAG: ankyrin repeat domain-containing protein [Planctomycetota bacterium]|nr:ankyrin repeat domain-containing protein [Planctomycetota bacterium]
MVLLTDSPNDRLVDAVERRDWAVAKELLKDGTQIATTQPDGMTALHWAVFHQRSEIVTQLLASGASVDALTHYEVTPLGIACLQADVECVRLLVEAGADVNRAQPGGETPLITAARNGSAKVLKTLIENGANTDATERKGQTALMWAAAQGNGEAVQVLIDSGADLRMELKSGFNAMMFAAREGRIDVVRRLLDAGVDVNAIMGKDKNGRGPRPGTSALMLAVESGHFELALYFVSRGADPNDQRSEYTPLHALSWVRKPASGDGIDGDPPPRGSGNVPSLEFVRKMVRAGANVNAQLERGPAGKARLNMKGATPFLLACKTADLPLLKVLLELGANPNKTNVDNCPPLLAAAGIGTTAVGEEPGTESEVLETLELLLGLGADVNSIDNNKESAMHGAAYRAHPKVAQYLADRGAKPSIWNHANRHNWTPMSIARGSRPGSVKPDLEMMAILEKLSNQ